MSAQEENNNDNTLSPWDPRRYVRKVDPSEARLSRGFLRCRPEKWFPGFAAQWLPLGHSLGLELRVSEIRATTTVARSAEHGFCGSIDGEPMAILVDHESQRVILEAFCPGATSAAREAMLEYLVRRMLTSLALTWSGGEGTTVQFDSETHTSDVEIAGAVKLVANINGNPCTVWLALGRKIVERLDGLWRRQMQSSVRQSSGQVDVRLELAQLAVKPSMLVDYMRSGTVVDLEIPLSDTVTLRSNGRAWLPARLCDLGGRLGFEVLPGPANSTVIPEGMTRLAIEFPALSLDGPLVAEIAQVGSFFDTGVELSDRVDMVINGEKVAEASLCVYEGRFAISVV